MQERPVVVKEGNNSVALVGILAIVVFAAIALYFWQPWNAPANRTTNVIVQPGAQSAGGSSGTSGSSGSAGSSSSSSTGAGH